MSHGQRMSAVHPAAPLLPPTPARAGDGHAFDGADSLDRPLRTLAGAAPARRERAAAS